MARADVTTLLPLDRYAVVMGINRYTFNNLDDGTGTPLEAYWHAENHHMLGSMLHMAERLLRDGGKDGAPGLGYDIAPRAAEAVVKIGPDAGPRWWDKTLYTPTGRVQVFGTQEKTRVAADAAVVFVGDSGIVTVSGLDDVSAGELALFVRVADGADSAGAETWQIRPVKVTVSAGTATCTAHKAQFVLPEVLEQDSPAAAGDAANYVAAVDVYRVTVSTETPLTLTWDAYKLDATSAPGETVTQKGVAFPVNLNLGAFKARPVNASGAFSSVYGQPPESVTVSYIAGYALAGTRIFAPLETAAVRLTNTLLPDTGMWVTDRASKRWRNDRAMPTQSEPLQPGDEHCPYGLQGGALAAWRVVQQYQRTPRAF